MRIDNPISSNAQITGSFTGSFKGDGSLLAGVTAEWDGSHNGNASITGSLNVSSDIIVGGTVDGVDVALLSSNYSLTSASAASNTAAIAALDSTYATDSELSSLSGSAHTDRVAKVAALSGSAHTQRTAISGALASSIGLKAPLESPTFTGTVSGVSATHVGLGNVTNESKATMFSSPTFTGTVSGVSATHVGLGNVTNESKATMFSSPTFTGTVSGVTATHVGLGNVTNESKATMFSSPTFTGTVAGVTATHVGLGNVTNTSDANKPVSTAQQTALNLKANLASPTFTGTPLSTTPASNDNSTKIATTAYVQGEITDLIGGAGAAFDTLLEISASIANGDSDVVALTSTVGGKLTKADNLSDLTNTGTARTNLGVAIGTDVQAYNATLAAVAGGTYSGDDSITTIGTVTAGSVTAILPAGTVSGSAQINVASTTGDIALGSRTSGNYVATMTAGTGITVGTATGEGSTPVITNTGVTSNVAGTGITVSGATGAVTITNSSPNATHSGDVTGATALTIANNAVTNAKAADMAVNTIKGRITAGTGNPEDLTAANVRTIINVADGATANSTDATLLGRANHTGTQTASTISDFQATVSANSNVTANTAKVTNATHSGDVTGATALTIANNAVTNAKLADMEVSTIKGRYTAGTGDPQNLNATEVKAIIGLSNTDNVHFEGLMIGQTSGATANTIRCVGDVVAYYSSDLQFKDNVQTLEGALDKVKAIRGVRFDWNDKQDVYEGHDIGVIAQEVEAVLPELVHHREYNDSKAVDYVKLTAVLIEAVKELAAKVDELSK